MCAGGMAGDVNLGRIAAIPQNISIDPDDGRARLANDFGVGYIWTEVILYETNACAAFGEYRDEVAVVLFVAAAPVAAVNINQNRTTRLICRINVQLLSRRTAVRYPEPGLGTLAHLDCLLGALLCQFRILRHRH